MAKSTSKTNTITLEGAFSSIQGLNFDGKKIKNGRELIKDKSIQHSSSLNLVLCNFCSSKQHNKHLQNFYLMASPSFLWQLVFFFQSHCICRKLVVSADYQEIRARNYIPVPNTTSPILKKGITDTDFSTCLL